MDVLVKYNPGEIRYMSLAYLSPVRVFINNIFTVKLFPSSQLCNMRHNAAHRILLLFQSSYRISSKISEIKTQQK